MTPIRLLIVDNHTLFRQGLISLLQNEHEFLVVGEAASGDAAVQQALALQPDVVLMDVTLPGVDGIETACRLQEALPGTRVMMLTVSDGDEHLLAAIHAGARGYLLKNADADELFYAIRHVHAGEAVLSPAMTLRLFHMVRASPAMLPLPAVDLPLTKREQDVLRLLAQGQSNRQIAQVLMVSENTVKTHVRHILEKLELDSRSEAVALVRRKAFAA
jgi:two-component system nitrate/nitrite response regulator NarL